MVVRSQLNSTQLSSMNDSKEYREITEDVGIADPIILWENLIVKILYSGRKRSLDVTKVCLKTMCTLAKD